MSQNKIETERKRYRVRFRVIYIYREREREREIEREREKEREIKVRFNIYASPDRNPTFSTNFSPIPTAVFTESSRTGPYSQRHMS